LYTTVNFFFAFFWAKALAFSLAKIFSKEAVPKLQFWNSNLEICSFVRLKA
jgi:hypothetical protein